MDHEHFDADLAVKRGASLLDTHRPGWASRINLEFFDIGSCTRCILGQEFGRIGRPGSHLDHPRGQCPYDEGLSVLGLSEENGDDYFYGFDNLCENEQALNEAWKKAILERTACLAVS